MQIIAKSYWRSCAETAAAISQENRDVVAVGVGDHQVLLAVIVEIPDRD